MAAVNYRGVEAVCSYIESVRMSYFGIFPAGRSNAKPVYKQSEKVTPAKAADKFREWAGVILGGDPDHAMQYELRMYDAKDNGDGEDEILAGRSGMVVSFQLTTGGNVVAGFQPQQSGGGISMDMYMTLLKEKSETDRRADRLEFENNDLKRKLLEAEQELEEMEDEGDGDDVNGMGSLTKMFVPMLMNHLSGGTAPANINGTPEKMAGGSECNRCLKISPKLMTAIGALQKADVNFDEHLTKLSNIARTNPGQYHFLTNALDNM